MPFADAKYPDNSPSVTTRGERMTVVRLANGELLQVIERTDPSHCVVIALADREHPACTDLFVCEISPHGVLSCAYSDDACRVLAEGR